MKLGTLLSLQALFAVASLCYLGASAVLGLTSARALSAAPLLPSIVFFLIYSGCLLLPRMGHVGWYRIAMIVAIVLFGGGGVIGNGIRYFDTGLAQYASFSAWLIAVAINAYGTILNVIAALGFFRSNEDRRGV